MGKPEMEEKKRVQKRRAIILNHGSLTATPYSTLQKSLDIPLHPSPLMSDKFTK
jgi:hypothetical protein